jgi:rhodanese-related sulfurtransferase
VIGSRRIEPGELHALLASDAPHAVLDVRERATYERGHIYRATSLPRRLLEFRLAQLVTASCTPVVAYDDDGGELAQRAAETIAGMGYADVRVLGGGLAGWRASGRRIVQGVNVPSKVFGERMLHALGTPEITAQELKTWIDRREDMLIVDSRTPEEYRRGCIPGAVSVPGGELVPRIGALIDKPETTIVVHCGGRTRSYIGAESLRRMCLPNRIVALQNGTMGWELAGFELERGAERSAPPPSAKSLALASAVAGRVAQDDRITFVVPHELRDLLARRTGQNLYVLDVRTNEEYAAGHIAGSVWAPGGQAVQATDEYVAVRHATIVLVCDGVARSVVTASWLGRMGFPDVRVLRGGLPAWVDAGERVAHGDPVRTPFGYEAARDRTPRVRGDDAARVLAGSSPPIVLDVDQSDAYVRGHLPGAVWVCRSRLERHVDRLAPDRRAMLVTCTDGLHSTLAAATLRALGHEARVLEDGKMAWHAAGQPLEPGPTTLVDEPDDVVVKPYDRGRAAMDAYLRWEEALDEEGWSPYPL